MTLPSPKHGTIYIYELQTLDYEVIYVGQTVRPRKRQGEHRISINELIRLVVLCEATDCIMADHLEIDYIQLRVKQGCKLLNKQLYDRPKCVIEVAQPRTEAPTPQKWIIEFRTVKQALLETKRNIQQLLQRAPAH